jgi:outer membrane lipoprotein SlyB
VIFIIMLTRSFIFLAALLLTACASSPVQNPVAKINFGIIESLKPIALDASTHGGAAAGQVFGQIGGSSGGVGRGAFVGMILGGVIGGTAGREAGIATKPGLEIWVKLEEYEQSVYAMQPAQPDAFKVGQRVKVIRKGNTARVEALDEVATSAPVAAPVQP